MDEKTLTTLEYPKILERLATFCAFPVSAERAQELRPDADMDEIRRRQAETGEALELLRQQSNLSIGGARDIRESVHLASRAGVLTSSDLLDIKFTMIAARNLERTFERLEAQYPHLFEIAKQMPPPSGLINAISQAISERGDILDSASPDLGSIRRQLRIVHDRLLAKLQRIVGDPKNGPMLQEAIITQRDGRYVLPLRAEFKGRIKSIVHDQSASGATLFVEPLSVVEGNNQYRELQLAERDEEQRILTELSQLVGANAEVINLMLDVVAELDLAFARGKYAEQLMGCEPVLLPIKGKAGSRHPGSTIRLYEARHPLLDPGTVVPIDVELDPQTYALVVTGPNTGGKTVTLKTVGLLILMAQSGLHIPVQCGSEISIFRNVYADIGDEQSIEQSLSTFSGHINNIIRILEVADQNSLVILDELGAGTDPQEGAALARALLTTLLESGITTLVTTHHPELKAFAHMTPGVVNASAEFDLETLRPTYHLTIGLPGRSNALAIAQRLGMPDSIIEGARSELAAEDIEAEGLLDEIHRQRERTREARTAAEKSRREGENLRNELAERLEGIEDERREVLDNARIEAEQELEELKDEIRRVRRELARARQPLEILQAAEEKAEILEEIVEKPVIRQNPEIGGKPLHRAVRLGDKVRLRSLDTQGVVTTLGEEEAEVQVGMLRIRARLSDLQPLTETNTSSEDSGAIKTRFASTAEKNVEGPSAGFTPSPGLEIDLRGKRADEAIDALDAYLDSAYLAGLPFVRIIHGKGTGKLRLVVREALQSHPQVKSFEAGGDKEGGEGVTVAKLRD